MKFGFNDREVAKAFGEACEEEILDYGSFIDKMWCDFSEKKWYQTFRNTKIEKGRLELVYKKINLDINNSFKTPAK